MRIMNRFLGPTYARIVHRIFAVITRIGIGGNWGLAFGSLGVNSPSVMLWVPHPMAAIT